MASLFKRNGWYYLQFYSTKRSPKKKQIALKTRSKRAAKKLQSRLQDEYRLGEYDPWKDDRSDESANLSRLEDAVEEFLKAKSHLSEKYLHMLTALLRQFKDLGNLDGTLFSPISCVMSASQFQNWFLRRGRVE